MLFMNEFLEQHWDGMRVFLQTVSNPDTEMPMTSFDGYVDLPLRLAVLHGLLVDIIYQKKQVGNTLRISSFNNSFFSSGIRHSNTIRC